MTTQLRRTTSGVPLLALVSLSLTCTPQVLDSNDPPPPPECIPRERPPARVDRNIIPTLFDLTHHLFERSDIGDAGNEPLQIKVTKGLITPERIAVVSGTVYSLADDKPTPLPCAKVSILNEPGYGWTFSRADGQFEIVVNGDAPYTVMLEHSNYMPVQRSVTALAQRYVSTDDIVMRGPTGPETLVDLSSMTSPVVARGDRVRDKDGERQATLLFRVGTQAMLRKADGTSQPLSQITVQASEYTLGPNGRAAMPGSMPAGMGYTYAVEYRVKGVDSGSSVEFSRPVISYVENFLSLPTGHLVPSGTYNTKQGTWVPSANGRVIKILSITNGLADLDTNGDDIADPPARLEKLEIDDQERRQLASLYKPGQSLWRVPVEHFSSWDYNYQVAPPTTARPPALETATVLKTTGLCPGRPSDANQALWGVSLECDEARNKPVASVGMPVYGTPTAAGIFLRYANDQVLGYIAASKLLIPYGDVLPPGIKAIELSVQLNKGGAFLLPKTSYAPDTVRGKVLTLLWDGTDGRGNMLTSATAFVHMAYVFDGYYVTYPPGGGDPYADLRPIFGKTPYTYIDVQLFPSQRPEFRFYKEVPAQLLLMAWAGEDLGGLSLSIHHRLARTEQRLFLGDGRILEGDAIRGQIALFADNKTIGLKAPVSLVAGNVLETPGTKLVGDKGYNPTGSETPGHRIYDITGVMAADYLGTGDPTFVYNPALALDPGMKQPATVANPLAMALGLDNYLYFADSANGRVRVTKMSKVLSAMDAPTVFTLAGDPSGDATLTSAGPTKVKLQDPSGLTIGALPGNMGQQSLFIAEKSGHRIRHLLLPITPDPRDYKGDDPAEWERAGKIRLDWIVGTGSQGGLDNPAAKNGTLNQPMGMALWTAPDKRTWLFVADSGNHCIRRVDVTDLVTTGQAGKLEIAAGYYCAPFAAGFYGDTGDLAYRASFNNPTTLALRGNFLYVADTGNHRVRRISLTDSDPLKWTITTVAGNGTKGSSCSLTPGRSYLATRDLALNSPQGLAVTPDEIYVTDLGDGTNGCVRRLFNKISASDANGELETVQDPASGLFYVFDDKGKQRGTLNPDRSPLYSFYYDGMGRLACVYQNADASRTNATDCGKPMGSEKLVVQVIRDTVDPTKVTLRSDLEMAGRTTALKLQEDVKKAGQFWIQTVDAGGVRNWSFAQDAKGAGLMSSMTKVEGATSYTSGFTVDDLGRLTKYTDPTGTPYPVN